MTTATVQLADLQHPWIGLASFTEGDREFFAGRGEEIDELLRLVRRDTLTLLYGVSGLGKTSLLQAGLFPAIRAEDCLPVPIRLDYLKGAAPLGAQVFGAIILAANAAGVEAPRPRPDETLWEYLHREGNHFWSPHNDLVTPLLAFDQFEELFTVGRETPERAARTTAFIGDLADLVENRPPAALRNDPLRAKEFSFKPASLKVLLAMREDYLADLDRIRSHFRALDQNRLRLLPMGERQARQVIALGAPLLAPGVEDRILKFVAGGDDDAETTIAPALLSLALRELNERRLTRGQAAKITPDLLDLEQHKIFENFYLRTVQDFPAGVRTFIEDKLLTTTGYRGSCALDDALSCPDVTQPILDELVNRRLLAYEDQHHTRRVELTHDVLIPVIKASRDTRLTRDALARSERQQREAFEKERLARRRLAVVAVLLVLALLSALYGWYQAHRAEIAAQRFQQALTYSFFRTIGVSNEKIPARDEREALWELAQLDRDDAALRGNLLRQWTGTTGAFMRGEARDGQGFRAATGLNVEYHRLDTSSDVEWGRSLAKALENPQEINSKQLFSLRSAITALANKMEPQPAAEIAKGVAAALENPLETNPNRLLSLGTTLGELANKLEPQPAAEMAQRLAAVLENPRENNGYRFSSLGYGLRVLANKLEPGPAAEVAKGLAAALERPREINSERFSMLGNALTSLANKMEPQPAAEVARGLAAALDNPRETNSKRIASLGNALAALANKMEPQPAAEIAKGLATALENPGENNAYRLTSLGYALKVLANKVEPQTAAEVAQGLAEALKNPRETNSERFSMLGTVLAALANQLEPQTAAEVAQGLAGALENPQETNFYRLSNLGIALAALANKMEPQPAAQIAMQGAQRLAATLENPQETDLYLISNVGTALAALANKMEPQAAAQITRQGAQRVSGALENLQETDSYLISNLGTALAALANKMEPQAAAEIATRGARRLAAALENPQETDSYRISSLGTTLAALAHKMEPQGAPEIVKGLAAALEKTEETNPTRVSNLGIALAALANKMEPQAATEIAKGLAAALEDPQQTDPERLTSIGIALGGLANKMAPHDVAEVAKGLAAALDRPQWADSGRLWPLGQSLAAFCRLLPSAHRTHLLALSNMLLQPVSIEAAEGKEQPRDRELTKEVCAQLRAQDLAEVLKYPLCTGEGEQIVLKQLQSMTGQDFGGDVWKFVGKADSLGIKNIGSPATRPLVQDALDELVGLQVPSRKSDGQGTANK